MSQPKIVVVSLGGTITMTRDATGAIKPSLVAQELLRAVPGVDTIAAISAR